MILGIMQPYFFPYLGYFELIDRADEWIVFDTPQYIRHGWMNRNRILHPTSGWQYILAPLQKHARETPVHAIHVAEGTAWRTKILGQLRHYAKRAPHYAATLALAEECLATPETSLSRLNVALQQRICRELAIDTPVRFFSEMALDVGPIHGPGEWALRIASALGATEYINPPGGVEIFDPAAFAAAGVKLSLQPPLDLTYPTRGYGFEPHLSVLDALMWQSPAELRGYLDARRAIAW